MEIIKIQKSQLDSKTLDATALFIAALEKAKNFGDETKIEFEKGIYHFYKENAQRDICYTSNTDASMFPEKSIALNIQNQKNLTVEGNDSLFIMHGDMMALAVRDSENITLKNFSWDFPCATTLEMNVTGGGVFYTDYNIPDCFGIEVKGKSLHWFEESPLTGERYWENVDHQGQWSVVGFDRDNDTVSRYPLSHGPMWKVRSIENKGENQYRIKYKTPTPSTHKKGMCFEMCTSQYRGCTGAFVCESKNVEMNNIGVHYMHGFGFLVQMSEDVSFNSCNFMPRNDSERNVTSFADLIHVSGAKGKIHIENCNFAHAHDDPINIHGTYTRVKERLDKHTLVLEYVHNQQKGFRQYHEGDEVVFYSRADFEPFDKGRVFTVKSASDPAESENLCEMTVTFVEKLPKSIADNLGSEKKYVAENVTYTPEVYIGHCSFSHIPTRGILCTTGKKTLIENNIFNSMTMASIYLSNDCNNWYESGPIKDMTIRNNTFIIKRSPQKEWKHKGAIFIDPIIKGNSNKTVHRNITVEGNRFLMEHDNVLRAKNTDNIIFKNNKVERLDTPKAQRKIKAFSFKNCSNIKISENSFDDGVQGD